MNWFDTPGFNGTIPLLSNNKIIEMIEVKIFYFLAKGERVYLMRFWYLESLKYPKLLYLCLPWSPLVKWLPKNSAWYLYMAITWVTELWRETGKMKLRNIKSGYQSPRKHKSTVSKTISNLKEVLDKANYILHPYLI